jgi:thymidine phosphorylase
MITAREVIQKKRDREDLTAQEIAAFVRGYMSSDIADYQVAAWLMAVYLNGMTPAEHWH